MLKDMRIRQELTAEVNGQMQTWTERRFLIQSTRLAEAVARSLQERVKKAEQALQNVLVRKQGKPHLKTRTEIDEAIQDVIKEFRVEGFLNITFKKKYMNVKYVLIEENYHHRVKKFSSR